MKLKYFLLSLVAACMALVSCNDEFEPTYLNGLRVSSSYISFPQAGGTQTVTLTSEADWTIVDVPEQFTVSPLSGAAGTHTLTITTEPTEFSKVGTFVIESNGKRQYMNLQQEGASFPDFQEGDYWIMFNTGEKWIVAKPCTAEIGNGSSYAYIFCDEATGSFEDGTLASTAANVYTFKKSGSGFHVSDSEGGYLWQSGSYNNFYRAAAGGDYLWSVKQVGAQAYQIESNTSHVLCYSPGYSNVAAYASLDNNLRPYLVPAKNPAPELLKFEQTSFTMDKDGGYLTVPATINATSVSVEYEDEWLHYYGTDAEGLRFNCDENAAGGRSAKVLVKAVLGEYTAEVEITINQEGSIVDCTVAEFLAAEEGEALYRLTGRVTNRTDIEGHKFDLETYGNFDLVDATGNIYVYGVLTGEGGEAKQFGTLGVKEGDIITIIGKRTSYKGAPQVGSAYFVANQPVTKIGAADFNALDDDAETWYELTGIVTDGTDQAGHKFDLETYGNFDLVDETGDVYVYGLSTGWNGESKKAATLGLKAGDRLTIVAHKTSYKDSPQAGSAWYVTHSSEE